ncbi:hypothetical protein L7F22_000639 [Adiantum nelumboides]|nr:hypothetical protein [Adiantum nelumboides]
MTTIMPREIWTLHRKPEVASAVRAIHLEQFFRLPPWDTDYMRAHELMSSIQYDGKAMLTDSDVSKVEVLITKEIINEALQFQPGTYNLIPKTKAIDNEKAFLKVKGSKFNYSDLIYSELELPLRLISQHLRVQKPPANLKNSAKNKLYMSAGPMLTRIAYQALGMIEDLPAASSQAALIQQAKYVPKAVKMTSSAASSRSTRSRKDSSDEKRTDTDKDQNLDESDREDIHKEAEVAGPSEYERSDEEDTSTPLENKSQKPRSREQVLMDEAMARVEARRKELADARAAKAAKTTKPTTMEEARKLRMEKAKALQKERKILEAEEKAQEEAETAQAAQTQEKEIKEALSRKAEEPILEPSQGSPKRHQQEEEEEMEHIQADPIPSSPMNIPHAPPSSPITPFPPASTPRTPPTPFPPASTPRTPPTPFPPASTPRTHPSPSTLDPPRSPLASLSPQQQQPSAKPAEVPPSIQEETDQSMDRTKEEKKQTDSNKPKPAEIDLQIPLMQLEEPIHEEAYEEVKNFVYTKIILTLSRQFKCQQVVAKEIDFQKERADRAYEEINNLRTALELSQYLSGFSQDHRLVPRFKKILENICSSVQCRQGANDETPMLVNYLIARLHQAMTNSALQGEFQQQLPAYGTPQEERASEKSLGETSKRGLSTEREGENKYQELCNLLLDDSYPSRRRGHAQHEESPPKEKERSKSPAESMEEDVALQRHRAQRSHTPTNRKRSPCSPPHRESKREEKNSRKKNERKRSPLLHLHHLLPLWMKVVVILQRNYQGEDIEDHMLLGEGLISSKSSKREERASLSLPMMVPLVPQTKYWRSSNNLMMPLEMRASRSSQTTSCSYALPKVH